MRLRVRQAFAFTLASAFLSAAYWSVRLALADAHSRSEETASVAEGIRLGLGNAACHLRQAALLERAGAGADLVAAAVGEAVRLNPHDSIAWIELGLQAELQGDFASAERALLEAARVDRTTLPRMTLANYYFRRGSATDFWRWTREALMIAPAGAGVQALFRLCWTLSGNAGEILDKAIPNRPETLRQLLSFLVDGGHLDAAQQVAARILPSITEADTGLLLTYCDRLLEARRAASAIQAWNALVEARLLPYELLRPAGGQVLTNGDFRLPLGGRGYDWRIAAGDRVSISREEADPSLHLNFDGSQPEQCEILWQYLPLQPATRYRLSYEHQANGIPAPSGLRWQVIDVTTAPSALAESELFTAEDWRRTSVVFSTPASLSGARLALSYRRAPGTTRITGWVSLRRLSLTAISVER